MTDELGRTTTQRWRAFGNPSESRLMSLRDADQNEWTYEYNALGSLTRLLGPEGMERRLVVRWPQLASFADAPRVRHDLGTDYDPAGNITLKRVGGREVSYRYDGNNRLTRVDAGDGPDDIDIDYDAFDHRTRVANAAVESFFDYFNNRLDRRRDVIGGRTFATSFDYDSRDNLERIDYHSGRYVIYDYDHADRIVRVRGSNGAGGEQVFAADVDYHPSGVIKSFTFGNGRQETLTFDDRFRPDHLQSGPLDLIYDFDRAGNVETIIDARPGFTSSFQYDPLDRLTTVTGFGARTFTYDAFGNRRSKSTSSGHLDTSTMRTSASRESTVRWKGEASRTDSFGNMIRDPGQSSYQYTALNMLAKATVNGVVSTYGYDGDNVRTYRSTKDGVFYYMHGPTSQLLAEYNVSSGQPELLREYVYLGSKLLLSVGRATCPLHRSPSGSRTRAGGTASPMTKRSTWPPTPP